MTKIDLVTGFLGAGKTTFIRMYAKHLAGCGQKVCILENDFGAVNVDAMLLADLEMENIDLEMVAGGCDADCHLRRFKTKLIAMGMRGYDRVIVEPSGLYDVDEFFDCLYDEPLDSWYEIGSVITLVDAEMPIPKDTNIYKCFLQEMANAGICIISKVQNAGTEKTIALKNEIISVLNEQKIIVPDADDYFVDVPFSSYNNETFERIKTAGYSRNDYYKFNVDESGFTTLYYMNTSIDINGWRDRISRIFASESCGNVTRIKGFTRENGLYYEINATINEITVNHVSQGQDVMIIIGASINEKEINKIIY